MARDDAPPFGRGETFYGISPSPTIDSTHLGGEQHKGKTWVFEDLNYSSPHAGTRTGRMVVCRCMRNVSGISLLPSRLVSAVVGDAGKCDGYTTTTAAPAAGVVDEWLPSSGVPNNDLFWCVIEGPSLVLSDLAGGVNNSIALDQVVVALTAATSQATTAGRVAIQDLSGATTTLGNNIQNAIGRALTALTTGQTNTTFLLQVFARRW